MGITRTKKKKRKNENKTKAKTKKSAISKQSISLKDIQTL